MDNDVDGVSSFHDGNANIKKYYGVQKFNLAILYISMFVDAQPGLAFFYGGLVPRKSVLTIMMQVIGRCRFRIEPCDSCGFLSPFGPGSKTSDQYICIRSASFQ